MTLSILWRNVTSTRNIQRDKDVKIFCTFPNANRLTFFCSSGPNQCMSQGGGFCLQIMQNGCQSGPRLTRVVIQFDRVQIILPIFREKKSFTRNINFEMLSKGVLFPNCFGWGPAKRSNLFPIILLMAYNASSNHSKTLNFFDKVVLTDLYKVSYPLFFSRSENLAQILNQSCFS